MSKIQKEDSRYLLMWLIGIITIPIVLFFIMLISQNYQNYVLEQALTALKKENYQIEKIALEYLDPDKYPCFFSLTRNVNTNISKDYEVVFTAIKNNQQINGYVCGYFFFSQTSIQLTK